MPPDRLDTFKRDLRSRTVAEVVQRHVTFGDCFALSNDLYADLKAEIAKQYRLPHTHVLVVGSAKLGFSIAPQKRYRAFADTSDIDVVLCSSELYDSFWEEVFDYVCRGEDWDATRSSEFRDYHFRGWIRPDKLPPRRSFRLANEWWEFFRGLTSSGRFGRYKIVGALYKNLRFLEHYQAICVTQCWQLEQGNL